MDFKLSKDSADSQQKEAPGEKKSQSALLVLLLILIGGFTYIYFFTALIKPLEAQKATETTANAKKIPLPPRDGKPAKPEGKVSGETEPPKAAAPAPVIAAVPDAKPAVESAKTAPAPTKSKEEPKKAEAAKPADKKPLLAVVADKNSAKEPAEKDGKKKQTSDKLANTEDGVKSSKTKSGLWSLIIGDYVLEETLSTDMGRVRKAGLEPVIKSSSRKNTTMNRLLVSEFNDRSAAQSTLEKLKNLTSDAFIIEQGGKFYVYAGSYSQNEAANSEKERLKAAGFPVTVKRSDIAIPSHSLSVGPFNNKKDAEAALGKLKGAGIKATLSQK